MNGGADIYVSCCWFHLLYNTEQHHISRLIVISNKMLKFVITRGEY